MDEQYNGNITFLFNKDGATLELQDESSSTRFVKIELTKEQILSVLSREAYVHCNIITNGLDRVGKKMTLKTLTFPMPPPSCDDRNKIACDEATRNCPEGWIPDLYFSSRDSFFRNGEGKEYARTTIRRWE